MNWTTSVERDHAGFRLWRAIRNSSHQYVVTELKPKRNFYQQGCINGQVIATPDGSNSLISSSLIPAKGSSRKGVCYSFIDTSVTQVGTYYYVLEDINANGERTFHCEILTAVTRGKDRVLDLETAKAYCRRVTGSSN